MKRDTYQMVRNAYYAGIFILGIYAMPKIDFVKEYLYPFLMYEPVSKIPVVSIIAIGTIVGALMAYKYRKLG